VCIIKRRLKIMASKLIEGQASSDAKPLFINVNADEELETTEIESLCMQCGENVRQFCSMCAHMSML